MSIGIYSLSGKAAIITGSAMGIGRGIAVEFARAGADLVLMDLKSEGLEDTAEKVKALGRRAFCVTGNVRDPEAIDGVVRKTLEEFHRIDTLVNNAGVGFEARPEDITARGWEKVLDTDLNAPFFLSQAVGKSMMQQKSGTIINIGSVVGRDGSGQLVPYATAKAGLMCLTKSLAMAWARHNIRVNCIAPGYILTEGAEILYKNDLERLAKPPAGVPLGRWGRPEEIGYAAVFLASDASSYITGHTLFVDGGPVSPH